VQPARQLERAALQPPGRDRDQIGPLRAAACIRAGPGAELKGARVVVVEAVSIA
jgi:hypothetical protein